MTVAARGTFVPADYIESYGLAGVMLAQLDWLANEALHVIIVEHDGVEWIPYADSEWMETIGLSTDQAYRARRKLADAGEIEMEVFPLNGNPVTHLRRVRDTAGGVRDSAEVDRDSAEEGSAESQDPPLYETEETTTETLTRTSFDDCWSHYPRKVGKKAARKQWEQRVRQGADPDNLLKATLHYTELITLNRTENQFIMHPQRFWGPNEPWLDWIEGIPPSEIRQAPRSRRQQQRDDLMTKLADAIEREQTEPKELTHG